MRRLKMITGAGGLFWILVCLPVMLSCCGDIPGFSGRMDDGVVAMVNGSALSRRVVDERIARIQRDMEDTSIGEEEMGRLKKAVMKEMINRKLLLVEAGVRGIAVSPEEVATEIDLLTGELSQEDLQSFLNMARLTPENWERQVQEDLLIRKLVEDVSLGMSVSDEEVDGYYKTNRAQFFQPESVRARQIVVTTEDEAQQIRNRISQGADFAVVAREVSFSPDAQIGGDLGFFERGQMPRELEYVAFSLKVGQLSQVVETPYGHHLVLVEEKRPAKQLGLDTVRERIIKILLTRRREENYRSFLDKLREIADITYNKKHEDLLPDNNI